MDTLLIALFCPLVLLLLLVGGIVWLVERGRAPHTKAPNATPAHASLAAMADDGELAQFVAFDRLVAAWAKAGRLDAPLAERVRDLIAEEVATIAAARRLLSVPAAAPPAPAVEAAPSAPPILTSPPATAAAPVAQQIPPAPPALAAQVSSSVPPAPVAPPLPMAPAEPSEAAPASSAGQQKAPPRLARPSLGAALLSLGTRRTLLFLGTFLLLMSSLTLVVFSWASLPPAVQFAILAGTTGAIWAGGAWMARKPELATAGANLQAVSALLTPVVGFALGRPGLLDLAPRPAWQLASAVSLAAYLLASWRTRRPFYSGAAALAAASLLLAGLGALAAAWQLVPLMALMGALLLIAGALRGTATPRLAEGPRWVALLGGPIVAMAAAPLYLAGGAGYPFAATLALGALFCGLAYRLEGRPLWLWAAVALPPVALELALGAAGAALGVHTLAVGAGALVYLGLSALAEDRHGPATRPLFVGAAALGLYVLGLASLDGSEVARLALPPLVLLGAGVAALVEGGRLRWLGANGPALATGGLFAAGALGFWWGAALLEATGLALEARGLALLPMAAGFFAAARWWPGRLRPGYDRALQALGAGAALLAWAPTMLSLETRLAGALLVAAIFAGQAIARRRWPWAVLSLGFAALAAGLAVERFVAPAWQLRAATLVGLGLAAIYSLGGERLRRGVWGYWTWPAVALGGLAGLLAAAMALIQLPLEAALFSGVLLALAVLLGAHTALWRRAEPGYVAAPLLVAAALVAAGEGFFTGWRPAPGDLAYVVCALVLGLALFGQRLRAFGRAYATPYELTAFALLPAAPLFAGGDQAHLAVTWGAMAALYGTALWRYRLPWMLALALVSLDWALLHGTAWLLPGGDPAGAGLVLALAVAAQALFSAWARRRGAPLGAAGAWGYLSAGIGAAGALSLVAGGAGYAAAAAGLLAATLAVLAWVEAREELAWGALAMVALALSQLHRLIGLPAEWALLAGSLEAVTVYAGGWGVQALSGRLPRLALWRRPLAYGAGVALIALPLALAVTGAQAGLFGAGLLLAGLGAALLGWRERQP
ncbi:MAG TPA: hypothetical protein PKD53_24390, partial [Chloroflexaceae bacterium]|nr:hypothetical protein [Chloroflexaceae bacterium]